MIKAYLIWYCLAFSCSSYNSFCETKFYKEVISHPPKYVEKISVSKSKLKATFTYRHGYISERYNQRYFNQNKVEVIYYINYYELSISKITISYLLEDT